MRVALSQPSTQFFINLAGLLFSLGLAWTSDRTIEIVLWLILAALFLVQIALSILKNRFPQ